MLFTPPRMVNEPTYEPGDTDPIEIVNSVERLVVCPGARAAGNEKKGRGLKVNPEGAVKLRPFKKTAGTP